MSDSDKGYLVRLTLKENDQIIVDKILHNQKEINIASSDLQSKITDMLNKQRKDGAFCFPKSLNVIVSYQESHRIQRVLENNNSESEDIYSSNPPY